MKHLNLLSLASITREISNRKHRYREGKLPPKATAVLKVLDEYLDKWIPWAKDQLKDGE